MSVALFDDFFSKKVSGRQAGFRGVSWFVRIGITGASGFVGRQVRRLLIERGHAVVTYSRRAGGEALQQPTGSPWALPEPEQALDGLIHLAGEPVAGLWSAAKRERIRESRVAFTQKLVEAVGGWKKPPAHFLCASAVGYYGSRGEEVLTEESAAGSGFLAEVCQGWEQAAQASWAERVVRLRTGLVLGRDGGALPLMRRAFRLGGGGRLGDGSQWMPWIHIEDEAGLIVWLVENTEVTGAVNLAAPQPVRNADFTRALARGVHRPALFHAPGCLLRTVLGQMADEMLLTSQRVVPEVALRAGYRFRYPELGAALAHLLA